MLDDNFNLDDADLYDKHSNRKTALQKKFPQDDLNEDGSRREGLLVRLRNGLAKISLEEADLSIFKESFKRLKRFRIGCIYACGIEACICCMNRSSVRRYETSLSGVQRRLDLAKIVKTSVDLEVLKKLYLLPR